MRRPVREILMVSFMSVCCCFESVLFTERVLKCLFPDKVFFTKNITFLSPEEEAAVHCVAPGRPRSRVLEDVDETSSQRNSDGEFLLKCLSPEEY